MPDKQDAVSDAFALPGWDVVEAIGPDAPTFLQAQTMNDLRALEPGRWQWNGWLNPKGRVIALFALARLEAERFWIVLPDHPGAAFAERLRRFVFRSKVRLVVRDEARASGAFAAPAVARGANLEHRLVPDDECVELDLGGDGGPRTLTVVSGPPGTGTSPAAAPDADEARRWAAFDLAHGLPRLDAGQVEAWTPQMLSLERLHAFSVKKGCYPGQEIVARTHFLGQAKRELARVAGAALHAGGELTAGGKAIGTLVAAAGDEALAVVSVDRAADAWESGGSACRNEPLLDGLER